MKLKMAIIFIVTALPLSASAMPSGMDEDCRRAYVQYEAASGPKAFAKGTSNACGWVSSKSVRNIKDARDRAVNFCKAYGGINCKVVASQN